MNRYCIMLCRRMGREGYRYIPVARGSDLAKGRALLAMLSGPFYLVREQDGRFME